MNTTTITSKRQITIPAVIFREAKLLEKQKLSVTSAGNQVILTPVAQAIDELAGSLKMPARWKNKNLDQVISEAKNEHFKS